MSEDWAAYQKLVLQELSDLKEGIKEVKNDVKCLDRKVVVMQTKSEAKAGLWGAVSAIIVSGLVTLAQFFTTK